MFNLIKLSTSHMILIALFILISTIAILGYFESRKINSILERITYQMDSRYTNSPTFIKEELQGENMEQEQQQVQEPEQVQQQVQEPEQVQQQVQEPEQVQQEQPKDIPITFLTESKEEFSAEVPEDQSSFSLGAIFKGADSKDITTIDTIESDSEYGDSYSSEEDSEDPLEESDDEVKEILTEGIETMSIKQLKEVCKKLDISPYGTKATMINKIKDISK